MSFLDWLASYAKQLLGFPQNCKWSLEYQDQFAWKKLQLHREVLLGNREVLGWHHIPTDLLLLPRPHLPQALSPSLQELPKPNLYQSVPSKHFCFIIIASTTPFLTMDVWSADYSSVQFKCDAVWVLSPRLNYLCLTSTLFKSGLGPNLFVNRINWKNCMLREWTVWLQNRDQECTLESFATSREYTFSITFF